MDESDGNREAESTQSHWSLQCSRCGRVGGRGAVTIFDELRLGWPRCCGEDMELQHCGRGR